MTDAGFWYTPKGMTQENQIIPLSSATCRIELWSLGARLNAVSWGGHRDLVASSANVEEARGAKLNHGSVVGPVANRIAGATFDLEGRTYRFEPNEGSDTLCHSGDRSLRDRIWEVEAADEHNVGFVARVADMEDGFPGNREFRARYTVRENGFDLRLSARTDAPTLVNMALHPYWTINEEGRAGQSLMVAADAYLPIDDLKIPTGEIASVDGTIFDLRRIGEPSTEIDHNFCLQPQPEGAPSARVEATNGLVLDISTDAPGLQVFTGKPIGIAIEPQHWPDAMHHAEFPSIRLDPGKEYTQMTRYRFSKV